MAISTALSSTSRSRLLYVHYIRNYHMGRGRSSLNLIRVVPAGVRHHCAVAQPRTVLAAHSTIPLRSPQTHKCFSRFLSTQSTAAGSLHTQSKSQAQSQSQSQSQANTNVLDDLSRQANAILISKYTRKSEVERDAQLLLTSTLCSDPLVRALYNSSPSQQETIKLLHRAFLRITSLSLSHNSTLSLCLARRARLFGLSLHLPLYQDLLLQAASAATSTENNDKNDPDSASPSATILEMASIACQSHQVTLESQFFTASLLKLIHRHLFEDATIVLNAMAERHGIVPLPTETAMELMLALQRELPNIPQDDETTASDAESDSDIDIETESNRGISQEAEDFFLALVALHSEEKDYFGLGQDEDDDDDDDDDDEDDDELSAVDDVGDAVLHSNERYHLKPTSKHHNGDDDDDDDEGTYDVEREYDKFIRHVHGEEEELSKASVTGDVDAASIEGELSRVREQYVFKSKKYVRDEDDNDETSSATDDVLDDDEEDEDEKSLATDDNEEEEDDDDEDDRGVGWRDALNRYIANINADAERDHQDDDAEAAIMNQLSDMNLGDVLSPETLDYLRGFARGAPRPHLDHDDDDDDNDHDDNEEDDGESSGARKIEAEIALGFRPKSKSIFRDPGMRKFLGEVMEGTDVLYKRTATSHVLPDVTHQFFRLSSDSKVLYSKNYEMSLLRALLDDAKEEGGSPDEKNA